MRLISLLIGLVIIAYLISKQLEPDSSSNDIDDIIDQQDIALPKVPVSPKDIKGFETEMNKFIQDTAANRQEELEKIEKGLNK